MFVDFFNPPLYPPSPIHKEGSKADCQAHTERVSPVTPVVPYSSYKRAYADNRGRQLDVTA